MSNANELMSSPNVSIIATASWCSIWASSARVIACIASQNRRWSSAPAGTRMNRSAAVVFHQSANASFEHGATTRFNAANARYVPTDAPASARRVPTTESITPITSNRPSTPQVAATAPKPRCRVRAGSAATSWASSSAAMSAAEPRYRSETILGLPSTRAISRRYQYGFPLITFLYRLAIL